MTHATTRIAASRTWSVRLAAHAEVDVRTAVKWLRDPTSVRGRAGERCALSAAMLGIAPAPAEAGK